jgi:hypothetical protein
VPDAPDRTRANPAGLIYGVLAIATVIAAESTRHETYPKLAAASAITIALYWLAHAYSHHWGSRIRQSAEWTIKEIVSSLAEEATILAGASIPAAVLVGAWLGGASVETGVSAVLWAAGVEVVMLEIATGLRRRLGLHDLMVQSLMGMVIGVGILAVRILLH